MPPPVTPSPHRFVIKKQPPPPRSQLTQESTPRPANTQQFNTTPRFTLSSTPRPTSTQGILSSTPAGRYLPPARQTPKPKTRERIEDLSNDYPAHLPLHDSIETNNGFDTDIEFSTQEAEDDYEIPTRSSKRRRISPSAADLASEEDEDNESKDDDLLSSSLPIISSPISRNPIPNTHKPKFLLSTPVPSTPQSTPSTFLKPPRFRPPDPAEIQGVGDPYLNNFLRIGRGRNMWSEGWRRK